VAAVAEVTPVRVLLVDDDPLVRSGLALILGGAADLEVAGQACDGDEAIRLIPDLSPDVVLMDIRMPTLDGVEATRVLKAGSEKPRILVLTTFGADDHVVAALSAGADGFLLKDTPPADIVTAVRRVDAGEPAVSPAVLSTMIGQIRENGPDDTGRAAARRLDELTDRERQIALAVGRGLSNAEIAAELYLSVPTVKAHVGRVFAKLGVDNRVQIAILVHNAGEA
jgi:DNA-binding NarL/FixJ family response regulator